MSSKYINNNYPSGYTLSGVYQSVTVGPSGFISGAGLKAGTNAAYTIDNLGKIVGNSYAAVYLGKGGIVINGDTSHTTALIKGGVYGIDIERAAGTVTNFGTIECTGYNSTRGRIQSRQGILLRHGGLVTNGSTGDAKALIEGGYDYGIQITGATGTVVNFGTVTSMFGRVGIDLYKGGSITNAASGLITGIYAAGNVALVNSGTITALVDLSFGGSVVNTASGTITDPGSVAIESVQNTGTVINSGHISGYFDVVAIGQGSVTNTSSGTITGVRSDISISGLASSLVPALLNNGTIAASGSTSYCVNLNYGGRITNSGSAALIAGGSLAIHVTNGAGTVTNSGSITASGSDGVGVSLGDGGLVTNASSGSIVGANQGVYTEGAAGTVMNTGKIAGSSGAAVLLELGGTVANMASGTLSGGAVGVQIDTTSATIVNFGSIIGSAVTGYGIVLGSGGSITNMASGVITGGQWGVKLGGIGGGVLNRGTILGGVLLSGVSGTVVNYGIISSGTDAVDFTTSFDVFEFEAGSALIGTAVGDGGTLQLIGTPGTISGIGTNISGFSMIDLLAGASFTFASGDTIATGTKFVADGTLIDAGTLEIDGSASFDGSLGGGGTLVLDGIASFHNSAALTVAAIDLAGGTLSFVAPRIYAGSFTQSGGTLALDGQSFTLTGAADALIGGTIEGPGNLYTTGTTTLAAVTIGGRGALRNSGTLNETGILTLGDAAGTGALVNLAAGTFDILSATGIAVAGSSGSVINQGLFQKTAGGGLSSIGAVMNNQGTIAVTNGTLDFQAAVSGTGVDSIGTASTLQFDGSVAATQSISFNGSGGDLVLNDPSGTGLSFAGTVAGFGTGDEIDLASFADSGNPSVTWSQHGGKGTLTITDGGEIARIILFGQYMQSGFHIGGDAGTGTAITYTPPSVILAKAAH